MNGKFLNDKISKLYGDKVMSKNNNANRGGKRPGAGRPPGSRNKATLAREAGAKTLTDLARERTEFALDALADVAGDANATASARVSAAIALLDRAWGRPPQHESLYGRFERLKPPTTQELLREMMLDAE